MIEEKLKNKAFNISEGLGDVLSVIYDISSEINKLENKKIKEQVHQLLTKEKKAYCNYDDLNINELKMIINKNTTQLEFALNILRELINDYINIEKIKDIKIRKNLYYILSDDFEKDIYSND